MLFCLPELSLNQDTHIKMQECIARKCIKEGNLPSHFCKSSPSSDPQRPHEISRTYTLILQIKLWLSFSLEVRV